MPDLIDQLRDMGAAIPKWLEFLKTEEATKNSLVMPFIIALGYNVSDPLEVVPEFCADFGQATDDKVDYAVCQHGKPLMLWECKWAGRPLKKKDEDQLRKYFAACPDVRVGILTNGLNYLFFTDLEKSHVMDEKPFLEFDMQNIKEPLVQALKGFTKAGFRPEELTGIAEELKYMTDIRRLVSKEFKDP
ncbi:MAG: type I restriction endonuclease, partial [Pseudomonadota bacterium]